MSAKSKGRKYKRLVLGDVIEIPLSKRRLVYAQFVYYHRKSPGWGHLIRVLPGVFSKRPDSFSDLVQQRELYSTFFMEGQAVNMGQVTIVSGAGAGERCQKAERCQDPLRRNVL